MAQLRALAGELGLLEPRTLLQSGNLVFGAVPAEAGNLADSLRRAIEERLGVATPVIVRTHPELIDAIAANPFPGPARTDPSHLLVVFLDREADTAGLAALRAVAHGEEVLEASGRQAFIHYAHGVADSKLTAALIDRRLGATCTARNWNTVLALDALANEIAARF
jgi:uncharacterized protein (DUF1697 family)